MPTMPSTPPADRATDARAVRLDFPVEGMTCAACATRIGKGLGKLDGVERAQVNLATNRATVLVDPELVTLDDLKARVDALGYSVPEVVGDLDETSDLIEQRRQRTIGRRLTVAAVLTVPLLAISMVPPLMFTGWPWVA